MAKRVSQKADKSILSKIDRELVEWGITRVPMDDRFQFGDYQYSSLEYAVAQAKREKVASK